MKDVIYHHQTLEKLSGIVHRVTFHSDETGWSVLKVTPFNSNYEKVTVTIHQTKVFAGATIDFYGSWVRHPKFGEQFKANKAVEKKPASSAGLEKYLGSGLIFGVGPKTAKRLVKHFGKDTLTVFEEQIERITEVPGIAQKKLQTIRDAWQEHKEIRNVMIFLQSHGISTLFAVKIYKMYGASSISKVTDNPYCLANDIYGIGFFSADKVALSIGIEPHSEKRIIASIKHILAASCEEGHCYLTKNQVIERCNQLLQMDITSKVDEYLIVLEQNKLIAVRELPANQISDNQIPSPQGSLLQKCYYSRSLFFDEKYVSDALNKRKNKLKIDHNRVIGWINKFCEAKRVFLSSEQKESILGILPCSFSVLTGGPGCGKTTTTQALVKLLLAMGRKVPLAAPTGRAAQRMMEVIGLEAKTIHRLLKWDPATGGFKKNDEEPLDTDYLVIDECSMLDISLTASLLKAVPMHAQVLFIGDADQLPSVGAGNVLKDIIGSNQLTTYRLTKVFRQAAQSDIIRYAHEINAGKFPLIDTPFRNPKLWKQKNDCMFIDSEEATIEQLKFISKMKRVADSPTTTSEDFLKPDKFNYVDVDQLLKSETYVDELKSVVKKVHPWSTLNFGLCATDMIKKLYTSVIPQYLDPKLEIQILSPMTKGSLGTVSLNNLIQECINPSQSGRGQIRIGEKIFRIGDRIIQKRNNYDLGVYNGDIGIITAVDNEQMEMVVNFTIGNQDKTVTYKRESLSEVNLAYAITIHKSQGSEFDIVIIPTMTQHFKMLYRNLIYTGLTRAKKLAIFLGTRKALAMAVKNVDSSSRQTALSYLLSRSK